MHWFFIRQSVPVTFVTFQRRRDDLSFYPKHEIAGLMTNTWQMGRCWISETHFTDSIIRDWSGERKSKRLNGLKNGLEECIWSMFINHYHWEKMFLNNFICKSIYARGFEICVVFVCWSYHAQNMLMPTDRVKNKLNPSPISSQNFIEKKKKKKRERWWSVKEISHPAGILFKYISTEKKKIHS